MQMWILKMRAWGGRVTRVWFFWVLLCFCFCLLMEKSHDQTFLEHDLHLRGEVYSKKLGGQWGLAGGRSVNSSVEMNPFI